MITCPRCGAENADDARFCSNCANPLGAGTASGVGEVRKTVTIMFMDAVGSTGLGERTDPESLEPLNENESRELMVNLLGQVELGADLVEKIGRAAEGNPLFVEERVGMLIDNGFLVERLGSVSRRSRASPMAG